HVSTVGRFRALGSEEGFHRVGCRTLSAIHCSDGPLESQFFLRFGMLLSLPVVGLPFQLYLAALDASLMFARRLFRFIDCGPNLNVQDLHLSRIAPSLLTV